MLKRTFKRILFFLFITFFIAGCIEDKCAQTFCYNEGVCVEAECVCLGGFEGADCKHVWDDKFEGKWVADDTYIRDTTNTHIKYDLTVNGGTRDSFMLYGLIDTVNGVICKRSSLYTFTIPTQVIDCFITINSGKGTIDSTTLNAVKGIYTFRHRDGKRDTTITINTRWTK